ncbi:MAG: nuclear transport factor 2 family protein [Actinomycetota bacterium]
MSELTTAEIDDIADRLLTAITAGDTAGVLAVYAPDARIWHNFDQRDQTPDENLLTLADMHRRVAGLAYTDIRRFAAPGGFVQQHTLRGDAKHGPLELPAMIRFWVSDGHITRLEEYLDTAQAMVMYRPRG